MKELRSLLKMLEAVRRVSLDEERIWVCQEVVNSVTLWKHTHVANRVHIIVCCAIVIHVTINK